MTDHDTSPPNDLAAERCVLGGMLTAHSAIIDTLEILTDRDFYQPTHATIYRTIINQYSDGKPTDIIAVASALTDSGDLARIGGGTYLSDCQALIPTIANTAYYARTVSDRAGLRRLQAAGQQIAALAHTPGHDAHTAADKASSLLYDAVADRTTSDLHQIGDLVEPTFKAIEEASTRHGLRGISTGLADLDHLTGGLRPGQFAIIAARPSMGKSVLAVDIARTVALRDRQPFIFFSLEMSKEELMMRLLAAECSIPLNCIIDGQVNENDWTRMARRAGEIAEAPLYIDDSPGLSLLDIRAKARRLAARGALGAIVIDYLQLMSVTKSRDQREREVAEISRGLKLLAKELAVPVIAVAQLNRGPEARLDKKPHLSDLRESGSLEQDADVVILLHRPDYYDRDSPRGGEVDIDVAKNRSGPTGLVTAVAQLQYVRFANFINIGARP